MNTIREIEKINQEELDRGLAGTPGSWHAQYRNSAWVYAGNLDHELTEGDVICVMSQYGEIEDIHLIREEDTGKSQGFAFVKYEDCQSCVLAVDNFVGVKLCGRSMRVDHVEKYRLPKKLLEQEEANEARNLGAGHAYQDMELSNKYTIEQGQDLFAPVPQGGNKKDGRGTTESSASSDREKRKRKEERKQKRDEKEDRRRLREERHVEKEEHKRKKRARSLRDEGREDSKGKEEKKRRKHDKKESKQRSSRDR